MAAKDRRGKRHGKGRARGKKMSPQIDAGTFIGYQDGGQKVAFWIWRTDELPNDEYWILRSEQAAGDYRLPGASLQTSLLQVHYLGPAILVGSDNDPDAFKEWVLAASGLAPGDVTCIKHERTTF